jgi:fucose permease
VRSLVLLCGLAFVSLGLPDGLLGVAWPSMRHTFGRDLDALGMLLVTGTVGYVCASFASGPLLRRLQLGGVLALSCGLTSGALAGYAIAGRWGWLLPLSVVLGLGGGAIDAALNSYVAANHGARTLNSLHACFGVGAALGPLVMTSVLSTGRPWQRGYALVSAAQLVLAAAFVATAPRWPAVAHGPAHHHGPVGILDTLRLPAARLGIVMFVAYTGLEASMGAWTYTLLTAGRGIAPAAAGVAVSLFWGGLTAGRVLAATVGGRYAPAAMLHVALAGFAAGAVALWLSSGIASTLLSVAVAGLAAGPIFPTLTALTPARVGAAHLENAVGFQIAAGAIGISAIPALVGILADATDVTRIPTMFVVLAALLLVAYLAWHRFETAPAG